MGICVSCNAAVEDGPAAKGKLILAGGELVEFDRPMRASCVLEKSSDWFVCDADEMDFDGFVSPVASNEELRLGQIYFVLPRSMLKRALHAEDLAALAVKASKALVNGRTLVAPLVFDGGVKTARESKRRRGSRSDRGRNFVTDLSAIPE